VDIDTVIYQQDGATSHCSNTLLEWIHCYFSGKRLICCRTNHPWSAWFGLHVLNTYLLGIFSFRFLKDRNYADNLWIIEAF